MGCVSSGTSPIEMLAEGWQHIGGNSLVGWEGTSPIEILAVAKVGVLVGQRQRIREVRVLAR